MIGGRLAVVATALVAACSGSPAGAPARVAPTTAAPATAAPAYRPMGACAPGPGTTKITVTSPALGHDVRVTIVTAVPTGSLAGAVYLLHGAGADETQWTAVGVSDALAAGGPGGAPRPMAAVLPDLPSSYDVATDTRALADDVIPAVESCLGRVFDRSRRAVGGISRGGELALSAAAARPELFVAVGGHSPVPPADGRVTGERLAAGNVAAWLDVGEGDPLQRSVTSLDAALSDAGVASQLHRWTGTHHRSYWRAHVADYLTWYSRELAL